MIKRIISLILITIIGTYMGFASKDKVRTSPNNDLNPSTYSVLEKCEPDDGERIELEKELKTEEVKNEAPSMQLQNNTSSENIDNDEGKNIITTSNTAHKNDTSNKPITNNASQAANTTKETNSSATQINTNQEADKTERIVKEPTNSDLQYIASKVFERINVERQKKGVSNLIRKEALNTAAKIRASEIISKFSHTRPNGKSFYTVLNEVKYGEEIESRYFLNGEETNEIVYDFGATGENITNCNHIMSWNTEIMPGFTCSSEELNRVADYISTAFINSPPHYITMVDKLYTSVGVSVSYTVINPDNPDKKAIRFYCEEIFTTK